jgi:hypothetical protein
MKEIIPSPDFVDNVMVKICNNDSGKRRFFATSVIGHIAANLGTALAAIIGIVNLIRIFSSVYMPAVCH